VQPYINSPIYRDVSGFRVWFKAFRPHGSLPEHSSRVGTICVVAAGEISENDVRGAHEFETADVVYRPPSENHANRAGCSGARVVLVEACDARLAEFARAGFPVKRLVVQRSSLAAAVAARISTEIRSREPSPIVLEGLALQLWGEALRPRAPAEGATPTWLRAVTDFIAADLSRRSSVPELAEMAGVSESLLAKSMRRFLGCSMTELRLRLQVERATHLLADTKLPIAEVALRSGFYDQSHLARTFHRVTGYTPAHYRRQVMQ
jgi:AraC family transcriptional regulator